MLAFGLVVNEPGVEDAMLQLYAGGTASGMGETHFAFASDCSPRAPTDGSSGVQGAVLDEKREATSQVMADEWALPGGAYARGVGFGAAR